MLSRFKRRRWTALLAGLPFTSFGCSSLDSFNPVSHEGVAVINLFNVALVISALIFLLVISVLTYSLLRFRARPGDGEPPQIHGNRRLEIFWTATPALLLAVMFFFTVQTMNTVNAEPPGALRVRVVGHQWWWEYQYEDLGVVTANELRLPVDEPIRLQLESPDVIHSFWVPQFGWKKDVVPGHPNVMNVHLNQTGTWDGACAEYCGTQHAWMRIRVIAQPRADFDAWIAQQRPPAAAPTTPSAQAGQQVFLNNTCVNCHVVAGTSDRQAVGPDLTHLASRNVLGAGVADTSRDTLRQWVKDAHSIKPGVLMPAYPNLSDSDLDAIADYLAGLK